MQSIKIFIGQQRALYLSADNLSADNPAPAVSPIDRSVACTGIIRPEVIESLQALSDENTINRLYDVLAQYDLSDAEVLYCMSTTHIGIRVMLTNSDILTHIYRKYSHFIGRQFDCWQEVRVWLFQHAIYNQQLTMLKDLTHIYGKLPIQCLRRHNNTILAVVSASVNSLNILEYLLDEYPFTVDDVRDGKCSAIANAADHWNIDALRLIFDKFPLTAADICGKDGGILARAIERNDDDGVVFLIDRLQRCYATNS